jgi:WhiB family redox-sensing transcriptional regulator
MSAVIAPIVTGPPSWSQDGVCATYGVPDLWFSAKDSPDERRAMALCRTCPMRRTCDQYATENEIHFGVWGGISRGDARGNPL